MAEKRRLDTLINTIDKLKNSDAYFFIVDEPCRGTIERVSEQFVIQLCNKLAENEKCVSVLATHLEKPTFVAQENPQYLNYQMELQDNEYAFVRTFKLLPGAADWWFNNEPKRTRFLLEL
jgi:DNA mismatch repair ATPase MutS